MKEEKEETEDIKRKVYKNKVLPVLVENDVSFRYSDSWSRKVPISSAPTRNPGPDCQHPAGSGECPRFAPDKQREPEGTDHCCSVAALPENGSEYDVSQLTALRWPTCLRSDICRGG